MAGIGFTNGDPTNDAIVQGRTFGQDPYVSTSPINAFTLGGSATTYNDPMNMNSGVKRVGSDQVITNRLQGLGQDWGNRAAPMLNLNQANGYMDMGTQARGMDLASRQQQQEALGMMRARAMGQVPSVAQMQGNYALGQALNDQQSAVASARGGAGAQALAARGAMLAGANIRGNIGGQSAIAAAQERNQAEQNYLGGASGMRGQDQSMRGLDYGAAGLAGQWAGQNAQLQMGMNQLNQQGQLSYEQMAYNSQLEQLRARMQMEALAQGHWQTQTAADAAAMGATTENIKAGVAVGASMASGGAGASNAVRKGDGY